MSDTSVTTDSLPAAGSGACTRIPCEPCNSMAQLNDPTLPAAPNAGQQITAYVGSTCWSMSWLFSVVNDKSSSPAPTPSAYSNVSRSVHSNSMGSVVAPTAFGSIAMRVSSSVRFHWIGSNGAAQPFHAIPPLARCGRRSAPASAIFCTQPWQTHHAEALGRAGYSHAQSHSHRHLEGCRRTRRRHHRRRLLWVTAGTQHHVDLHPARRVAEQRPASHQHRHPRTESERARRRPGRTACAPTLPQ